MTLRQPVRAARSCTAPMVDHLLALFVAVCLQFVGVLQCVAMCCSALQIWRDVLKDSMSRKRPTIGDLETRSAGLF